MPALTFKNAFLIFAWSLDCLVAGLALNLRPRCNGCLAGCVDFVWLRQVIIMLLTTIFTFIRATDVHISVVRLGCPICVSFIRAEFRKCL